MLVGQETFRPKSLDDLLGSGLAARLESLDVLSRKMLAGKLPGERRSKRRGRSVEFDDFRNYVPGDDLRHIDWNVHARLDRFFLKLFREEEDLSITVALDVSTSMDAGKPSKIRFGAQLATALAYVGLINQNRVSVACFGAERLRMLAPLRGKTGIHAVCAFLLEQLSDQSRSRRESIEPFGDSMRTLAMSRNSRGIVIVLSDWLMPEGFEKGLAALGAATLAGSLDTYAVMAVSPGEMDPAKDEAAGLQGDVRLTDVESGKGEDVTLSPARVERYKQARAAFEQEWKLECSRRGVASFKVSSETSVADFVLQSLRRGGLLV